MILGKLLREHREKHGWSIRQMGKKIGVQYDALYRFERGRPVQMRHLMGILRWVLTT